MLAAGACGRGPDLSAGAQAGGEVDLATGRATVSLAADPLAARADSLVQAGRPWRATALLAPRLGAPASASPELRLAGARAAAAWDGWTEVDRLLRGAPWLDSQFGGEGRELLVRGLLERGQDAAADARLALDDARDDAQRVTRRVLLARAYDRANARDSAADSYLAAAARLPSVADWLRLRAAGVTGDSAARARLLAAVRSGTARARVPFTDAQARERSGDFEGAARVYTAAGDASSAFRVASLAARDDAARGALARRIIAYLGGSPASAEVRPSVELLDKLAVPLSPQDELTVARAAADNGLAARAAAGFGRAASGGALSARDRMTYASVLSRAGKTPEALRQYASLAGDSAAAPLAAYQRARLLVQSGDGAGGRDALRAVAASHPGVRGAAAPALLLLADLQVDDGDLAGASRSLAELVQRYPDAAQAPLARFRAGLLEWGANPERAAATFDSLAARHPSDEEATAARYWAARAYDRAGKRSEAERRWREIIAASPLSYYAQASARRLEIPGWTPPAGPDSSAHVASVDSAVSRVRALERLGLDVESRFELDALADRAERSPAEAPAIAQALVAVGQPSRALRVALRALDRGTPSRALYRAAFPVVHEDALVEESRRNRLDPALVAGLIRQESSFNPRAVSVAGARGLMQLMPSVGASIAKGRGYPLWNPALLFDPDVSLELGTAHLATSLKGGDAPARALAAYNAGASRVARWTQRPGTDDPELFAELIPFTETRDYVRIVQRNADVYRALYSLK
jgi:soluble lytic murein transglycosylase